MAALFQNVQPYTLNGISETTEIEVCDDEYSDSEHACGDVQGRSAAASKLYGVLWTSFSQGHSKRTRYESFLKLIALIQEPNVAKWYVGVSFCPVHRFSHGEAPHKHNYDALYVLYLGFHLEKYEKSWLDTLPRAVNEATYNKCQNKGTGGERVRKGAVRYLYVCLRYILSPTGGFQEHEIIEEAKQILDVERPAKRRRLEAVPSTANIWSGSPYLDRTISSNDDDNGDAGIHAIIE